jgi:hypothetical protein
MLNMKTIVWVKDNFSVEEHELKRTAAKFSDNDKKVTNENLNYLKKIYSTTFATPLSISDWRRMTNTDSFTTTTVEKMNIALERNNAPRDIGRIFTQYASLKVSCPIAIRLGNNSLELIAGNTRLMAAKVLGVTPKIIILKTDW